LLRQSEAAKHIEWATDSRIAGNLRDISVDQTDLDELSEKTSKICANLKNIEEAQAAQL